MAQGKRYKFNGSTFAVQSGLGTPKTVTGVSQANPGVVTALANGFADADVVKLTDIGGMTPLSANLYVVDNADTDDFELAGTDTTAYPAFSAATPNLAKATPVVFTEFCELTGASQSDAAAAEIDVSTICSTAKEFETGLSDSGTIQLDYNFAPNQPVQGALRAAKKSGDQVAVQIEFPNDGGIVVMLGIVQQTSFQGSTDAMWTGSATLKLTGEIFVLPAA
jgi:Lambda phage tail tube protein, TTP